MAQCKHCGSKGLFLSVNEDGLCRNCQTFVYSDVSPRIRILKESADLALNGKTYKTRINRCDFVLEIADYLKKYEDNDINFLEPPPSEIIKQFKKLREEIIMDEIEGIVKKAISKAKLVTGIRSKENAIANCILKVQEIMAELNDKTKAEVIIKKLKGIIHKLKYENFIEAAKKAEFKGNLKKALDQYQEALFYLLNDEVPDELQKDKIDKLKMKIGGLKNRIK